MSTLLRILYRFAPPVHKHPARAAHEWPVWDDPYKPLEPGEDWAGNVREIVFHADASNGRKLFKHLEIA